MYRVHTVLVTASSAEMPYNVYPSLYAVILNTLFSIFSTLVYR